MVHIKKKSKKKKNEVISNGKYIEKTCLETGSREILAL